MASSRDEARRRLGLSRGAQLDEIKQAYRRLVREHHPDRGGDPGTFASLHDAYELLLREPADEIHAVRGRPSRRHPASLRIDVDAFDWSVDPLEVGHRLDRDRLAVLLAHQPVDLVAASRAPRSRLNRLAPHLAGDVAARLRVHPTSDDRGQPVVGIDLRAPNRRARRALETASLDGRWLRRRGSSTTTVSSSVVPVDGAHATAALLVERIEHLLGLLEWDMSAWTVIEDA